MLNYLGRLFGNHFLTDWSHTDQPGDRRRRFRQFRNTLLGIMVASSTIPLLVTAGLSYNSYQSLLEREERNAVGWNAESAKRTIEAFLRTRLSVISFVSEEYGLGELSDQKTLSSLFSRLKNSYPGLVDMGVINPEGIQVAYAGPYNFGGKDYADSEWFQKALARRSYVSDVFYGYRRVPHFVIAVSRGIPGTGQYWVLRASIDSATLEEFIRTVKTAASDDIFLVNREGYLQTTSQHYGALMGRFSRTLSNSPGITVTQELVDNDTSSRFHAMGRLDGTPWWVVVVKTGYLHGQSWSVFQKQLVAILLGGSALCLSVMIWVVNMLVVRVRQSDERRDAILSESEQTGKLASIGRLAAGVAHEINNPLAIIDQKAGLIQDILGMTLSETCAEKEKLSAALAGIQNSVNRCKTITHRLLGFARRMDVALEAVNINHLVKDVLSFLEREALYRRIKLILELDEALPTILSDRGQLEQVFLNIINNAIDAVDHDGEIRIATSPGGDGGITVVVRDSGPGIPEAVLQHIFEPFFTTKKGGKGTGLGLSITYGLVKKLGGDIKVESRPGEGALFGVDLPPSYTPVRRQRRDD